MKYKWRQQLLLCKGFPHWYFLIINQFYQLKQRTKILQGVPPRSLFFLVQVTPESESVSPTEVRNQTLARGSPTQIVFFRSRSLQNQSQFHQLKWSTNILKGVPPRSFFSPSGSLQNQNQLLIVQFKKKALPAEGQQLNSKYDTYQGRVLILRRIGYRTRYNSISRLLSI